MTHTAAVGNLLLMVLPKHRITRRYTMILEFVPSGGGDTWDTQTVVYKARRTVA